MSSQSTPDRSAGRFAPTPSGPLHFGSIIAALGSWLDARHDGVRWLLRIEDIDRPRVRPGASDHILQTLDRLGLHWDDAVLYQSSRLDAYRDALEELRGAGLLYACDCPRRLVKNRIYPGTCRNRALKFSPHRAVRLRVADATLSFSDALQGVQSCALAREVGDFIVHRADGVYAYHLASIVDDNFQGITTVVRGADLLSSSAPQNHLRDLLQLPRPEYCHLPVAVDADGRKISKRIGADDALLDDRPLEVLRQALAFLGQESATKPAADTRELLEEAIRRWDRNRIPRLMQQARF